MNIKYFFTLVVTILGCSYQIIDISNRYFSYATKVFASFEIVQEIHIPATSVCWTFEDVIEQVKELKRKKSKDKLSVVNRMYQILQTLTIANIFNSTPSTEEVLALNPACAVRLPNELSWRHPWYNRTECQSMITIEKYVHRLTLCYKFTFNDISVTSLVHNSLSPSKPAFIYMLFLNSDIFANYSFSTAYGHTQTSSPLFDSTFSYERVIRTNGKPFRIGIISTPMTTIALPKPYDTQCRSVSGYRSGTEYFLHRLNNETMRTMNHVHSLEHIHIPYLYPLLTPNSLRNKSISNQLMLLYDRYKEVGYQACYFKYNIPVTRLEEDERITIAVNWAQDNKLVKTAIPDQMIIDYIIYVCSSIGIWLGLSVFSVIGMAVDVFWKKSTVVDCHHIARVKRNRGTDSRFRDIQLITSRHSRVLCNLIKVINDQKILIQNQAVQIRMIREQV